MHRKKPIHIKGMRIKTIPKKKMGEYSGVHGKMPKNELPKNLRNIPKKDVLIRSDIKGKRRRDILKHEKIEIGLMDKGMDYKPAHRKTIEIMRKHHKDVVIRKGNKYYNTITGKYVKKTTAMKLNTYFRKHPTATLYEANGRPIYDKDKPWIEQSSKLHDFYKHKKIQVVKTRNKKGEFVYFNPLLEKKVSNRQVKKAMQFDYQEGMFFVQLFRMTAIKDRVYHILTTNIGRTIEEHEQIDELFDYLEKYWMPEAIKMLLKVNGKYPLSKIDVMYVSFDHDIIITNYGEKDNGAINIMMGRQPNNVGLAHFPEEMNKARLKYHALLNSYRMIMVKKVRIFIYSFITEENKVFAELRLGVYKRNGD